MFVFSQTTCIRQKLNFFFSCFFKQSQVLEGKIHFTVFKRGIKLLSGSTITKSHLDYSQFEKSPSEMGHKLESVNENVISNKIPIVPVDSYKKKKIYFQSWSDVQQFINCHKHLSKREILAALYNLKILGTSLSTSNLEEKENIINSDAFIKLFNSIEKLLPLFSPEIQILILEVIIIYNVNQDSIIFNKTAKLLLQNINNVKPLFILSIYQTLSQTTIENKYVKYLKLACLEYMSFCFDEKRRPDEPISSIIYFSSKKCIPLHIREKLIKNALLFCSDSFSTSSKILYKLALALYDFDLINCFKKNDVVLNKCIKLILSSIDDSWLTHHILSTFKIYCWLIKVNRAKYYSEIFEKISLIAINNKYPLKDLIYLQYLMLKVPHLSHSLLTNIINITFTTEDGMTELSKKELCRLINNLGVLGIESFGHLNLNFFKNRLQSMLQSNVSAEFPENNFLFLALNLAALDIYSNDIIQKASEYINLSNNELQSTSLENLEQCFKDWCYLLLNQSIAVMHPSYDGIMPDRALIKNTYNRVQSKMTSYQWSDIIKTVFGANCVLENCTTPLYHSLSYTIVLNKFNEAVDLSVHKWNKVFNHSMNIKDINLEQDHTLLVIIEFPLHFNLYFKNVDRLLGLGKLYIRNLKALGCTVVSLNSSKYSELLEVERIPYVINEVEKICGSIKSLKK